jgi:signal transduction histidine kinase
LLAHPESWRAPSHRNRCSFLRRDWHRKESTVTLSDFIRQNLDALLDDWERFAKSVDLSGRNLTVDELRDDAKMILGAIADDMAESQTEEEQQDKSHGKRPHHAPIITQYAQSHAMERLSLGFSLNETLAEYRALRASVIRHWTAQMQQADRAKLDELIRFNEAVDQGMTESIRQFSAALERASDIAIGVLVHDLRGPMSAIASSAEAILLGGRAQADEVKKTAEWIRNSSLRMQRIVDDLADFTHTRLGGPLPLDRRETDAGEACRCIVQEARARHADRKIELDCSGDLTGHWDPVRLEQLLSNLVSNALQYGRPRSIVTVRAEGRGEDVVLSVHNEGEPIPEDIQRSMFDPLVRHTADSNGGGGLGLGLYIVRTVADAHRGRIDVDSGTGGTTFTVALPRRTEEDASG